MSGLEHWSWNYDGWIVLAGMLCAVAASLPGNFLLLRRMSLLGDAISHAVLPGLAAAFFITGTRDSLPMFIGAAVVGILTALFTEWIRGFGKVDEGAAMGVVFTSLFAAGLVMIVQAADRVESVNGEPPGVEPPSFDSLTAIYPDDRIPLAADPLLRAVDLAAPMGLGQRGLLVAPSRTNAIFTLGTPTGKNTKLPVWMRPRRDGPDGRSIPN